MTRHKNLVDVWLVPHYPAALTWTWEGKMADAEAPPKHTEQQILDLELSRLSFSDLRSLWEFTGGFADPEWRDVQRAVYRAMHDRGLKFVERVRLVKAEEESINATP